MRAIIRWWVSTRNVAKLCSSLHENQENNKTVFLVFTVFWSSRKLERYRSVLNSLDFTASFFIMRDHRAHHEPKTIPYRHGPYETVTLWHRSTADETAVCLRFQINRTVKYSRSNGFWHRTRYHTSPYFLKPYLVMISVVPRNSWVAN